MFDVIGFSPNPTEEQKTLRDQALAKAFKGFGAKIAEQIRSQNNTIDQINAFRNKVLWVLKALYQEPGLKVGKTLRPLAEGLVGSIVEKLDPVWDQVIYQAVKDYPKIEDYIYSVLYTLRTGLFNKILSTITPNSESGISFRLSDLANQYPEISANAVKKFAQNYILQTQQDQDRAINIINVLGNIKNYAKEAYYWPNFELAFLQNIQSPLNNKNAWEKKLVDRHTEKVCVNDGNFVKVMLSEYQYLPPPELKNFFDRLPGYLKREISPLNKTISEQIQ